MYTHGKTKMKGKCGMRRRSIETANFDDDRIIPSQLYELPVRRFRASRNRWHRVSPDHDNGEDEVPPSEARIVTWNVSWDTPQPRERMESALRHLETEVFECRGGEAPEPCVVLLQEVHMPHGLDAILANAWVQEHFFVTPADSSKWPKGATYGNVTLIERSIPVVEAHLLEFGLSAMQRTGIIVDIRLGAPKPHEYDVILRIINTHLESLPQGQIARPAQMHLLSKFLKQTGVGVRGGIIAGDMNALSAVDAATPGQLGLRDAWRKGDKDERGITWGLQPRADFPPARLDKVLYLPRRGYRVDEPRPIGVGVKIESERYADGVLWTSDHYGLLSKVTVLRMQTSGPLHVQATLTIALKILDFLANMTVRFRASRALAALAGGLAKTSTRLSLTVKFRISHTYFLNMAVGLRVKAKT
ncbi:Endonuclease/exonuclease/phosphatase [Mycena sp. CBHHK59/15]|nr:Endonuclease/exonuclease/phosphatase [Mycena sp. CBHHK59/15]